MRIHTYIISIDNTYFNCFILDTLDISQKINNKKLWENYVGITIRIIKLYRKRGNESKRES